MLWITCQVETFLLYFKQFLLLLILLRFTKIIKFCSLPVIAISHHRETRKKNFKEIFEPKRENLSQTLTCTVTLLDVNLRKVQNPPRMTINYGNVIICTILYLAYLS